MPKTFCNDALTVKGRHRVKIEGRGHYIMSGSWIDTTCPSDMMDYGMYDGRNLEWLDIYETIRLNNT